MRPSHIAIAAISTVAAVGLAAYYFVSPHATLRVTTGHPGSPAYRAVAAFAAVAAMQHPRVHIETVEIADLAASAKAIEDHSADLALIRTDGAIPSNGETIAILRRDVFAIVTPAKTSIDKIPNLVDKAIGIPEGPWQSSNDHALDTILSYYNIPATSVRRIFLPMADVGRAITEKRIAAVLAIGPVAPGEVVDVVSAVKAATKGSPKILAIDEADAINKRFPGFESIDVPAGAFRGRPPIPDDTVSTLAVSWRFVAPDTMLDIVAGAIAQAIFTAKTKLMQSSPVAIQIEAPDPDDKNPVMPIHPGVVNYLNNGERSFFDEFQSYFYIGGVVLSALGSVTAIVLGQLSRRKSKAELAKIDRLIGIADQALRAKEPADIRALEEELNAIVGWFVKSGASGEGSAFSVAIAHARYAIERQRALLSQGGQHKGAPPEQGAAPAPAQHQTAPGEAHADLQDKEPINYSA